MSEKVRFDTNVFTTFERIGLLAEKGVVPHIWLENAYNSNVVTETSRVDYPADNNGRTHLRPL